MPSLTNVRLSKRAFAYNPSITIHESIIIGEKSFVDNTIGFEDDVTYGELLITECPNLRELRIGYYCFKYCLSFSLRNLSSLETFDMGNVKISTDSFMLSSFEMKSIIHYGFNE